MGTSPFRTIEERRAEREQKREAVMRAAVRMFNDNGFHATSLDDVASSLGVSKPTIYHYLGNKDQVLFECVTRGMDELRDAVAKIHDVPGNGLERLQGFLTLYGEITMDDFGRCVIRTSENALSADSGRKFRKLKKEIDLAIRSLIEEGIADGSIAPCDARMAAFTVSGALNWSGRWFRDDGGMDAATVAGHLVSILTNGLAPR